MATIGGFFKGVWRGLDGLRRALHLLLLLVLFGFVVVALRGTIPRLPQKAALVIHPQGQIVEQLASDPIQRAFSEASGRGEDQTLLWDLTDTIAAAATDERVQALVLELDDLQGAGQPTLEEVAVALRRFRATGKKVIALIGDGSSMYSIQALWTAAQLKLPITFIIVNNGRYEALHHFAKRFGLADAVGTQLGGIDFVGLAKAQGCDGLRVDKAADLAATLREAIAAVRPTLVEVVVG
jgi:hypothetical protein